MSFNFMDHPTYTFINTINHSTPGVLAQIIPTNLLQKEMYTSFKISVCILIRLCFLHTNCWTNKANV